MSLSSSSISIHFRVSSVSFRGHGLSNLDALMTCYLPRNNTEKKTQSFVLYYQQFISLHGAKNFRRKESGDLRRPARLDFFRVFRVFRVFRGSDSSPDWVAGDACEQLCGSILCSTHRLGMPEF